MANARASRAQTDSKTITHNTFNGTGEERDRRERSPEVAAQAAPTSSPAVGDGALRVPPGPHHSVEGSSGFSYFS